MTGRFFVINAGALFYSHKPGCLVEWTTLPRANEFQTVMSARYIAEKFKGARVVEMKGKKVCEVV